MYTYMHATSAKPKIKPKQELMLTVQTKMAKKICHLVAWTGYETKALLGTIEFFFFFKDEKLNGWKVRRMEYIYIGVLNRRDKKKKN